MRKIVIRACDDYLLTALIGEPSLPAKGVIVISPATGIRKEFYVHFASFLVRHGYVTLVYDYRGIGESAPADLRTSGIYIHEWGTKDMNAVLDYLVDTSSYTDIVWIGHSIGAQLVGFLENRQHIKKVVSVNAALGYWGYFPFPMNLAVWTLWYIIGPVIIWIYGYGVMRKIGWGENLPRNAVMEWREWCLSKTYFGVFIKKYLNVDRFYHFNTPITAVYTSDDYIANDKTAPMMLEFFPNSPSTIMRLDVRKYTDQKVGHIGIFRKRFECELWPVLLKLVRE